LGAYLAIVSPGGLSEKLIRTEPYEPVSVIVAPDGTVWTRGVERGGEKSVPAKTDRGVLRHFDHSGTLLGEFIPQSLLPPDALRGGLDRLACSASRVGWYVARPLAKTYYEIHAGKLVSYPALAIAPGESLNGLAIMDNDRVYISRDRAGSNDEVYRLDREHDRWNQVNLHVHGATDTTNLVLGGSGNTLVVKSAWGDYRHYRLFNTDVLGGS
jgi:hypothetical protein